MLAKPPERLEKSMADQERQPEEAPSKQGKTGEAPRSGGRPEPQMQLNTQYIKDLSFENPNAPLIFAQMVDPPEIEVHLDAGAKNIQDRLYEVALMIRVEAKAKDRTAFIVELEYAGIVTLGAEVSQTEIETLLMIEAPRHFFPFARAIVSNAIRDGGFPALLINPVDFRELYLRKQMAAAESTAAKSPAPDTPAAESPSAESPAAESPASDDA